MGFFQEILGVSQNSLIQIILELKNTPHLDNLPFTLQSFLRSVTEMREAYLVLMIFS